MFSATSYYTKYSYIYNKLNRILELHDITENCYPRGFSLSLFFSHLENKFETKLTRI